MLTHTSSDHSQPYVGRFAPSPTGPLHFGSLVAAMGSYLQARSRGGSWLVRMEDIDPLREVEGAAALILRALEVHGFQWDGEVLFQSRRRHIYDQTLARLGHLGLVYPCGCSRKELAQARQERGLAANLYPGTCRGRQIPPRNANGMRAFRVMTGNADIAFVDRLQGEQRQALAREVGDFVLFRADGQYAYQLAVVADDAAQGVTEVVRGSDLLDNTPRQIYLQQLLGFLTPEYLHLPVAVNAAGEKLSKQTHAPPLSLTEPLAALWQALVFLGQSPPAELLEGEVESFWRWAITHWQPEKLPATVAIPCPAPGDGVPPSPARRTASLCRHSDASGSAAGR